MLLLFASGLVWGRCVLSEGRHAAATQAGAMALDEALAGDGTAWARAEDAYGRAARDSLLDTYPLWVLELIRAWRTGENATGSEPIDAFLQAVRGRDYATAAKRAKGLEAPRARELAERLAKELRSAAANRKTAPPKSK